MGASGYAGLLERFIRWKWFPLVSLFFIVFGSWLNAQGGWIKDFSQYRTINLPLLFITFSTSGISWYLVGLFYDITGLFLGLLGIYMIRFYVDYPIKGLVKKRIFVFTIIVYLVFDFLSFYYFLLYYRGMVSNTLYGYVWNDSEYFVMLPLLIISDFLVFAYSSGGKNESRSSG